MITTTIFPSRYVQGPDALNLLADEVARLGKRVLLLQDPFIAENYGKQLEGILASLDKVYPVVFVGECSDEEIDRISNLAKVDVVIGVGGGKTLDTAKAVADKLQLPVVIVPTLASSDAPCSALAVVYTKEGAFKRYLFTRSNPNVVLVDSNIIVKAPVRFLISGIGDALATWFETESCSITHANNMTGRKGSATALNLAGFCFETLLEFGDLAVQSCRAGVTSPALERVVEANILLSGLGFESGGLAAAHAIHNGLTILEPTHAYWHGEKVAFGTLASLVLTGKSSETIDLVYGFCEKIGLPTTLAEIGLKDVSDADLMKAAVASVAPSETMHNEAGVITAESVFSALKAADSIGRSRK